MLTVKIVIVISISNVGYAVGYVQKYLCLLKIEYSNNNEIRY